MTLTTPTNPKYVNIHIRNKCVSLNNNDSRITNTPSGQKPDALFGVVLFSKFCFFELFIVFAAYVMR